jgi:hypothetical protein
MQSLKNIDIPKKPQKLILKIKQKEAFKITNIPLKNPYTN